jgi:transcription elongation factor Elf1
MSRIDKFGKKGGMKGLIAAFRELEQVKQQARALGIFTADRELLECPSCGLLEDVTIEGLLVTYPKASADLKDCGLRFSQVDETSFKCPSCGTKVTLECGDRSPLSEGATRRANQSADVSAHSKESAVVPPYSKGPT